MYGNETIGLASAWGQPGPSLFLRKETESMGLEIIHRSGTDQQLEMLNEPQTGLMLQDPKGQIQQEEMGATDPATAADAINNKSSFGIPFIIETVINAEETGGAATDVLTAAGDSDVFPAYDSTKTALTTGCPFKMKILDCWVVALSENTNDAADTITLQKVATNTTSQTDITGELVLNVADNIVVRADELNQDACVIDVTENIRFDVVLGTSGTTDHRAYKFFILAMRCINDE